MTGENAPESENKEQENHENKDQQFIKKTSQEILKEIHKINPDKEDDPNKKYFDIIHKKFKDKLFKGLEGQDLKKAEENFKNWFSSSTDSDKIDSLARSWKMPARVATILGMVGLSGGIASLLITSGLKLNDGTKENSLFDGDFTSDDTTIIIALAILLAILAIASYKLAKRTPSKKDLKSILEESFEQAQQIYKDIKGVEKGKEDNSQQLDNLKNEQKNEYEKKIKELQENHNKAIQQLEERIKQQSNNQNTNTQNGSHGDNVHLMERLKDQLQAQGLRDAERAARFEGIILAAHSQSMFSGGNIIKSALDKYTQTDADNLSQEQVVPAQVKYTKSKDKKTITSQYNNQQLDENGDQQSDVLETYDNQSAHTNYKGRDKGRASKE